MTATNDTTIRRNLVEAVADARAELAYQRERLMDEDNDGADYAGVEAADAALTAAHAALATFDEAHPEVLAAIRAANEPARIEILRSLRADEGLTQAQADELAALEAKHGKHYLDMTPTEQAERRARNAAAEAERDATFWAEWTPETTAARKAAWNDGLEARGLVRGRPAPKGLHMTTVQTELERALGFRFEHLKRAIAKHSPK